jgi:hypothetical protein
MGVKRTDGARRPGGAGGVTGRGGGVVHHSGRNFSVDFFSSVKIQNQALISVKV